MAKTAGAKTKVYSKYGREIYVCAKNGGIDPNGNLSLRRLLDNAKKDQVPAHVIDRAIEKAKGGGGEDYSLARYEGFGPGGSMVIVDCLTDNNNRTFNDVRFCFNKNVRLEKPDVCFCQTRAQALDRGSQEAAAPQRSGDCAGQQATRIAWSVLARGRGFEASKVQVALGDTAKRPLRAVSFFVRARRPLPGTAERHQARPQGMGYIWKRGRYSARRSLGVGQSSELEDGYQFLLSTGEGYSCHLSLA